MISNILTTTNFDSAALAGFASIAHSLREPGHWRLEVHGARSTPVQSVDIVVHEAGRARVAVDLEQPDQGTGCRTEREQVLAPAGMINLSAVNARSGGFVLLFCGGGGDPVWDSRVLEPGDYYACMLVRPGRYLIMNLLDNARSSVSVNYPDPRRTVQGIQLASGPMYLKVDQTIAPVELRIDSGQLLVFAVSAKAHLTITLEKADDGPSDLVEWRVERSRQMLEAVFGSRQQRSCNPTE